MDFLNSACFQKSVLVILPEIHTVGGYLRAPDAWGLRGHRHCLHGHDHRLQGDRPTLLVHDTGSRIWDTGKQIQKIWRWSGQSTGSVVVSAEYTTSVYSDRRNHKKLPSYLLYGVPYCSMLYHSKPRKWS